MSLVPAVVHSSTHAAIIFSLASWLEWGMSGVWHNTLILSIFPDRWFTEERQIGDLSAFWQLLEQVRRTLSVCQFEFGFSKLDCVLLGFHPLRRRKEQP